MTHIRDRKIFIITCQSDQTADYITNQLPGRASVFRLNTDVFGDYKFRIGGNPFWSIEDSDGNQIDNLNIHAIYYRKPLLPQLSDYEPKYRSFMQREIVACIEGVADSFPGICLSKPSILRKADNKIYQLNTAKNLGFTIPNSLITNDNNAAQAFCETKPCIVKPISIGKIYDKDDTIVFQTNQVDNNRPIEHVEYCPSYFQEQHDKDYELRVTIIGKKVFPVRIDSQLHKETRIDWRVNPNVLIYSETEMPKDLEEKCFELLTSLGLSFGAFDFIVRKNQYIFLEVNANGQWGWLEGKLGINISDAIIDYLVGDNQ